MTEEGKLPDEDEVDEEQLQDVAGGIGTWPTPERTFKTASTRDKKVMEPLDEKLMEPLDKDTLGQ